MAEIESAEDFMRNIIETLGIAEDSVFFRAESLKLIESRDNAVRLALLDELSARLKPYFEHARGVADTVIAEVRAKYTPTSETKESDG